MGENSNFSVWGDPDIPGLAPASPCFQMTLQRAAASPVKWENSPLPAKEGCCLTGASGMAGSSRRSCQTRVQTISRRAAPVFSRQPFCPTVQGLEHRVVQTFGPAPGKA